MKHNYLASPSSPDEISSINSRKFQLLSAIPPQDEEELIEDSLMTPSTRKRRLTSRHVHLDSLPLDLVRLAEQPLVRPTFNTDPRVCASIKDIAGNVTFVTKARMLVQVAISGYTTVTEDWPEELGIESEEDFESCIVDDGVDFPHFVCPGCSEPI